MTGLPDTMKNALPFLRSLACIAVLAACLLGVPQRVAAQEFTPDLGMAETLIAGPVDQVVELPSADELYRVYPLEKKQPRKLLSEVPGKPFKPTDPHARSFAWWKSPFYLALGLPRDLVDSIFGVVNYIPVVNLPVVFVAYEFIPTQGLMRDPRDWHRWPGRRNANGHGMYDAYALRDANAPETWGGQHERHDMLVTEGVSWGWFPSLNQWKWTYESKRKQRKILAHNEALERELNAMNGEIERHNNDIAQEKSRARREALAGIRRGNGREAVYRMLPYDQAYALDEGSFALLVTGLAMYGDDGGPWVGPLLWEKLRGAHSGFLQEAEDMMARAFDDYPQAGALGKALVYTRLLLRKPGAALDTALMMQELSPSLEGQELIFEVALSDEDVDTAEAALAALSDSDLPEGTVNSMRMRLALLTGETGSALEYFGARVEATPDSSTDQYFLGCANMIALPGDSAPLERLRSGFDALERAAMGASNSALRNKAGRALAIARDALDQLAHDEDYQALILTPAPEAESENTDAP